MEKNSHESEEVGRAGLLSSCDGLSSVLLKVNLSAPTVLGSVEVTCCQVIRKLSVHGGGEEDFFIF